MTEPTRQTPLAIEQLQREIDALRASHGLAKLRHAERVGELTLELLADHGRRLDELESALRFMALRLTDELAASVRVGG